MTTAGVPRTAALVRRGTWLTVWLCGCSLAWAGQATPPRASASASPDAQAVIKRIQESSLRRSYTGTFVVSSGGTISSSRIAHIGDGRNQIERIEALDGQMRRVYRHNDAVQVMWPRSREATIEQRELMPRLLTSRIGDNQPAAEMYEVLASGDDRVAGHDALVYTFRPKDNLRYAQRVWLERESGLLLRTDTVGQRGEVIESSAFSELNLDATLQAAALLQEMKRLDGYKVQRPVQARTELEREGWAMRNAVAGFSAVRCVKRPLRAAAEPGAEPRGIERGSPERGNGASALAERASSTATPGLLARAMGLLGLGSAAPSPPAAASVVPTPAVPVVAPTEPGVMLQALYSDGLTLVSVFIEPYDPAVHLRETPSMWGPTQALSRRQSDWWITAVGDVPLTTLQQFVAGMERKRP